MYPDDIYQGNHKNPIHSYTGASGEDEYFNAPDWNAIGGGLTLTGTGTTGHVQAIENALGIDIQGAFTNADARFIDLESAKGGFADIEARLDDIDVTLGTFAHGGFTNVTARFFDIVKAKGGFTNIEARLDDYDVTLGTFAPGGFTNLSARLVQIPQDVHNNNRFASKDMDFYFHGPIVEDVQFVSGISFPMAYTCSEIMVSALTPPVGAIGGHVDFCGAPDGDVPIFLSAHLNEDDFWAVGVGSSALPSNMPVYLNIPTGSSMAGLNVRIRLT